MTVSLRPMNLGEILDRTFQIYRSRFLVFLGIAALPALAMMTLELANQFWWKLKIPYSPLQFLGLGISRIVFLLAVYHISLLIHSFFWPVFADASARTYLRETSDSWGTLSRLSKRWKGLLGISTLLWFVVLVLPELAGALVWCGILILISEVLKVDPDSIDGAIPPITVVLTTSVWAVSLWMSSLLSCGIPEWSVEVSALRKALKRGRALSKGARRNLIAARMMAGALGWFLSVTLTQSIVWILFFSMRHNHLWLVHFRNIIAAASALSAFIASCFVGPIYPIAMTLIYYDQRIRREGFDIEWLMNTAGMNLPQTPPEADVAVAVAEAREAHS
jgi:hypothetical protein